MSGQDEESITEEVERVVDAIKAAVERLKALDDPEAQAKGAGKLLASCLEEQPVLREMRQDAVRKLRAKDVKYREIAAMLDVTITRVQQIEAGESSRANRRTAKKKPAEPPEE